MTLAASRVARRLGPAIAPPPPLHPFNRPNDVGDARATSRADGYNNNLAIRVRPEGRSSRPRSARAGANGSIHLPHRHRRQCWKHLRWRSQQRPRPGFSNDIDAEDVYEHVVAPGRVRSPGRISTVRRDSNPDSERRCRERRDRRDFQDELDGRLSASWKGRKRAG